jgi:hypothetical protein
MSSLSIIGIVNLDGMDVSPTEVGKIMAKYYIGLPTMELFLKVGSIKLEQAYWEDVMHNN